MQALCCACAVFAVCTARADEAILIGGGYNLFGSQLQIERNVQWVQELLGKNGLDVDTYFTDGDDPGADVHYQLSDDTEPGALAPLALVFGDGLLDRRRYRNHQIENVAGGTERAALSSAIQEIDERTSEEDLLLVFNGHGSQSPSTQAEVSMDLWGNTALTASELHALFARRRAPLRFIFTQCYSGGFHRLAYENPEGGSELTDGPRCGFTAKSAYRLAEGCSASVDSDDYRDYTTYFFAALSGTERDGDVVNHDPDLNGDSITSLREAHLYTLEEAQSNDLSRSTSEDFLEHWQPWFLRWLPAPRNLPNNDYARVFRNVSANLGINLGPNIGRELRDQLSQAEQNLATLHQATEVQQRGFIELQQLLQSAATTRWPDLYGPYTSGYETLAQSGELEKIASWLAEQPAYATLVDFQNRIDQLESDHLEAERAVTQRRKLLRLRRLAVLQQQVEQYGSTADQERYAALVDCEDAPLNSQ